MGRGRAGGRRAALWAILFAAACARGTEAGPAALTRGPYLQMVTTHSATVVWNTTAAAGCAVRLRPANGDERVIRHGEGTLCAVALDGLAPGATYTYTPLADDTSLGVDATFVTDDPARPFTFAVVGDSGSGSADQLAVRDRIVAAKPDFVVSTGDMVYEDGAAEDFDRDFFQPYAELLRRVDFWPVLGNHDVHTDHGGPWRDAFWTPANNLAREKGYYSFDHGNAHVLVLDSNAKTEPGSPQYVFADADLGVSHARWKIVVFHHAIYSTGSKHGSKLDVRRNLVPLFDRRHVDVVFNGHNHVYERTKPLRDDAVVPPGEGTVYVTTGGGGKALQGLDAPAPFTAYAERAYHFVRVAVDGDTLALEMVRADGQVRDALRLTKSAAPS